MSEINNLMESGAGKKIPSRYVRVVCETCGLSLSNKSSLTQHIDAVHLKKRNFVCKICDKSFYSNSKMKYHQYKHSEERNYNCLVCNKTFKTGNDLNQHKRIHFKGEQTCDQCQTTFIDFKNYERHMRTDHTERTPQITDCEICLKTFSAPDKLRRHMKNVHEKIRNFKCNECNKSFAESNDLKTHIGNVHLKQRNHICYVCNRGFSKSYTLRAHELKVHEQSKTKSVFSCSICNSCFPQRSALTRHLKTHSKDFQLFCDICEKTFVEKRSLLVHLASHFKHVKKDMKKKFICSMCEMLFSSSVNRKRHEEAIHKPKMQFHCKFCSFTFARKDRLIEHELKCPENVKPRQIVSTEIKSEKDDTLDYLTGLLEVSIENYDEFDKNVQTSKLVESYESTVLNSEASDNQKDVKKLLKTPDKLEESFKSIEKTIRCVETSSLLESTLENNKKDAGQVKGSFKNILLKPEKVLFKIPTRPIQIKLEKTTNPLAVSENRHTCKEKECEKTFSRSDQLRDHMDFVHKNLEKYQCECGVSFGHRRSLKRHKLIKHAKTGKFKKCDICGKQLRNSKNLENHRSKCVLGTKCKMCSREFNNFHALRRHVFAVHEKSVKLICDYCGLSVSHKGKLLSHIQGVHLTSDKVCNKLCQICGKKFSSQHFLRIHKIQLHPETIKSRKCGACGEEFIFYEEIKKHVRNYHKNLFVCLVCGEVCADKDILAAHTKNHRKPAKETQMKMCEVCGLIFNHTNPLLAHMRTHTKELPFGCEICGMRFNNEPSLVNHQNSKEDCKTFQCDICQKVFNQPAGLKLHSRVHSKEMSKKDTQTDSKLISKNQPYLV